MNSIRIAAAAVALGLALGPIARADDKPGEKGKSSETTIHGVVAGVTIEGETVDYKAKKAVEVEGAFLTVVGMPAHHHDASAGEKKGDKAGGEKTGEAVHHRANIYHVWLTPRTKVCTCCDESGKACEKKECGLDKLEVGDRVEVKFSRRDNSVGNVVANLTESMRAKHGRHRMYSVDAQEIIIQPAMHDGHGAGSNEPKDKDKDKGDR